MELFLLLVAVPFVISNEYPVDSPLNICNEPLDRGTPGPNPGFKYYFDKDLIMCLRYRFEGAGGGKNTFPTEGACVAFCVAADQFTCGANKEPVSSCVEWDKYVCPAGSTCKRGGLGVGLCCDDKNEAEWDKDYNPNCANGYDLVTVEQWWGTDAVRGRRCADQFCPNGSQCFDGRWIAHCCQPKKAGNHPQTPSNEDSPYQ